jgi:hypothetical protein
MALDRKHFAQFADCLIVALAVSLPWSTSATSILAVLWLLTLLPTLDLASLRRVALVPAAGLTLLLVGLGVLGLLWADVPWAERFDGVESFLRLLCLPLLLLQFERSGGGRTALIGFLASCAVLLGLSWLLLEVPENIQWPFATKGHGIPVKDYIAQNAEFTICIFVILRLGLDAWAGGRRMIALLLALLALAFLANIFYVATSRTYLVVIPVLLLALGYRQIGWKGLAAAVAAGAILAATAWAASPPLRERVTSLFEEVASFQPGASATSAGERLEYWRKSLEFLRAAPILGHGTGSIRSQFRAAAGASGMAAEVAANPHNQIFAVGIQIGLVGIAALLAMWIAHLALFRATRPAAWVGLVVVIENIVGSLFNSHLFDFTHAWIYILGVGVAGGVVLHEAAADRTPSP